MHAVAAVLHALQAVIVLGLVSWLNTLSDTHGVFALTRQVSTWVSPDATNGVARPSMVGNFSVVETTIDSGSFDVRYAVLCFFVLAFADHACAALSQTIWNIESVSSQLRYCEYSISASVMSMCIAVESGISDLYTLITIFVLIFATQIMGLLADILSNPDFGSKWNPMQSIMGVYIWVVPHGIGWICCIAAYVPILDSFISSERLSPVHAPGFVFAIIVTQFILFISFGFVQCWHLWRKSLLLLSRGATVNYAILDPPSHPSMQRQVKDLALLAERVFIVLSLVAKTLLAWLVLSPIVMGAK